MANLYLRCRMWGTLPFSGGVFDQPADLWERFGILEKAESDVSAESERRFEARIRAGRRR